MLCALYVRRWAPPCMKCSLTGSQCNWRIAEAWRWHDTLPGEPREPERFGHAPVCPPWKRVRRTATSSQASKLRCCRRLSWQSRSRALHEHVEGRARGTCTHWRRRWRVCQTANGRRWQRRVTMCVETCSEQPSTSTAVGMAANRGCWAVPTTTMSNLSAFSSRSFSRNQRLKKVCYKVSLCENCQPQSCKAFIGLTICAKIIGGDVPFCLKFWVKVTALERNRRFLMSFFRSDSAVTPSEKNSVNTNRKSTTRFPVSP